MLTLQNPFQRDVGSMRWDPTGQQLASTAGENCLKIWCRSEDDNWMCKHSIEHHAPVMVSEWCHAVGKVDPPQLLCARQVLFYTAFWNL